MHSGPDAFDESKFVMTFLTNLGVTWILCSSELALEVKACKEIPESSRLEFFVKFLGNCFALSDTEDNTLPYAYYNGEESWDEIGWNRHSFLSLTKLTKKMFFFFSTSIPVMKIYFTLIICSEKFLWESKFENFLHELRRNIFKWVQDFWPWLKLV